MDALTRDYTAGADEGLYEHDIAGSIAHARMLGRQGIIPEAEAGAIVVVPPDTAHGFTGIGPGRLRMVTIHASPRMETTWLEGDEVS